MVQLHNGVLFSSKKQGHLEICRQMDRTINKYLEWDKPDRERQTWYVLIHKWISDIKQRNPREARTLIQTDESRWRDPQLTTALSSRRPKREEQKIMNKGVKTVMGKTTESADPSYWNLIDSKQTTGEPSKDWTRPYECKWQWCALDSIWGHW